MSAPERVWRGAGSLEPYLVEIDTVKLHPDNPRQGDVDQIAVSFERFGQVRAILVDADGVIIAGNHSWKAAKQLGWTHVAAIPNQFSSPAEARAYLLADNRLPERGDYEPAELLALLEELEAEGRWEGTGYEADHLEDLRAELARVPETAPEAFKGGHADAGEVGDQRRADIGAQNPMKEVVLAVSEAQHAAFTMHIGIIQRELGLTGIAEAVYDACENQAKAAA